MIEWKPIATIPDDRKDGRYVLLWEDDHACIGQWRTGQRWRDEGPGWIDDGEGGPINDVTMWADINAPLADRMFAFCEFTTGPLKYVLAPGVTVEPGDWLVLDLSTGKVRKAVATDLTKFIAPLGSRMTDDGYLEMPL